VLARLLAGGLGLLVLVRLASGESGTVVVLLVGLLPFVLLLAYPLLLVAAAGRDRPLGLGALALATAQLLLALPALGAADLPAGTAGAPRLRVVTANLYVLNPDPAAAGRVLRALRPDVLVVPELDAAGLAGLDAAGLLADLPHRVVDGDGRTETVGLLSRLPLRDVAVRRAAARALPRATVTVGGVDVRVLASHPLPPISVLEPLWAASLADLTDEVSGLAGPAVVAGDLNADRDHARFRRLLGAGLRDAHDERGRGLARTWPAAAPLLHLDHVLVRDGAAARLAVLDVHEVRVPGSDHLAVVADVAVLRR
jgi:endonuclease/exonuclease/phosphatase (EEP) superfamily protein YafD